MKLVIRIRTSLVQMRFIGCASAPPLILLMAASAMIAADDERDTADKTADIELLVEALDDGDKFIRIKAAAALKDYAPDATGAISPLIRLFGEYEIDLAAIRALLYGLCSQSTQGRSQVSEWGYQNGGGCDSFLTLRNCRKSNISI